jgi:hypothetical protein
MPKSIDATLHRSKKMTKLTSIHHRENIDVPNTALCGTPTLDGKPMWIPKAGLIDKEHRSHYLVCGPMEEDLEQKVAVLDCPACLRLLFLDRHQGYLWMTKQATDEGEAKARAQNEAERLTRMMEAAQSARLGLAAELRAARASLDAAMEDVHALLSSNRAGGQVRAGHDVIYQIYRDEVLLNGTLTAEVRQRILDQTAPGDMKRMREILAEDEARMLCSAMSRRNAREVRARQVVVPEAKLTRPVGP